MTDGTVPFDLLDWMQFPWCCENVRYDKEMTDLPGFFEPGENPDNEDGNEVAFFCKAHNYRILIQECPGMKCPQCKLRHHDVFVDHLHPEGPREASE